MMRWLARLMRSGVAALMIASAGAAQAGNCPLPASAGALMAQAAKEMNAERAAEGRAGLARNAKLDEAAQRHACWMAATGNFSHEGAGGTLPKARIRATGYSTHLSAENIAWGQESGGEVISEWMGSPGHRRNILLGGVDEFGIGVALMRGRVVWVMDFAAK